MTKLTSVVLALAVASPAFGVDETGRKDESPAASENGKGLSAIAYVRSDPYHGVNYTVAHSFGPEAVPMLLRMLEDEREKVHWANIITALGMIADPEATGPLIDFLERRFKGDVDSSTWQALLAVAPSLGFLATDPQSNAFLYLRDGSRRRFWETRDLLWTYPTLGSGEREILLHEAGYQRPGHRGELRGGGGVTVALRRDEQEPEGVGLVSRKRGRCPSHDRQGTAARPRRRVR